MAITPTFVLAGKAIFTASSPSSHFTFRVDRKEVSEGKRIFFVSVLSGPDNTSDYSYLGLLDPVSGGLKNTKASPSEQCQSFQVARWVLGKIWSGRPLPAGYAIHHAGRCGRCGRMLTVPESIESGIGPDCAAKMARSE